MIRVNENALNIYTDGSCLPSPRRGGIGARFVFPEFLNRYKLVVDFSPPGYKGATNNEMELMACIFALKEVLKLDDIQDIQVVDIYTDSMYVCGNYKTAKYTWSQNGWLTQEGGPVLNYYLWKDFLKELRKVAMAGVITEIHWVKGHDKNEHNNAVDKLAKKSAEQAIYELPNPDIVRRKMSLEKTQIGSVDVCGQRLKIRIISGQFIPQSREHRYRFEVISENSNSCGKVDFLISAFPLREGHSYEVSFKKKRPTTISKMICEISE